MKRSHDVHIDEQVDFDSLLQNPQLLEGLKKSGYEKPSPIQLKAIPLGRLGMDLIAQAKSGTGKTVVFGVITLETVQIKIKSPQAMLIAPTREIAIQIRDVIRNLGQTMEGLVCEAFIGGLSMAADCQRLAKCHVMVGTPGRLMALLDEKRIPMGHLKLVVLDEADKLMSTTFQPQIAYIFKKLKQHKVLHQSITFSATFTDDLLLSLSRFLKSPQTIRLTEGVPTLHEVQQYYVTMESSSGDKLDMYKTKFEGVEKLLSQVPFYQCMIFVNSLPRSIELSQWLNEMGWKSGQIHSNLNQEKRMAVMEQMRAFKLRVLVCSDLIARGIDIDRVNLVINLDMPWEVETYLHRVGRTGRYGTSGIAINLIGPDDQPFLKTLSEQGIRIDPLPQKVAYNEFLKELSETDQASFQRHQSNKIESKPMVMKKKEHHAKKQKTATDAATPAATTVAQATQARQKSVVSPHYYFHPPDLFF
ncbi:P-loop containing nucleoside triphosphate hydrolase protein [Mucor mucedo]|uniref:P-loop containing nucleoside triphosphate hydrolase protein n=1 Tax=Mucor mucedo TaxID=29922 RepID=UPI00221E95F8|nr:P-loop containing nucleoside triphosphate hydrolase protein [Mucor mucedo]KAI7895903.1 P-loop containing nucleoside triphosphate hydrolase protein [Mucor mucedo]